MVTSCLSSSLPSHRHLLPILLQLPITLITLFTCSPPHPPPFLLSLASPPPSLLSSDLSQGIGRCTTDCDCCGFRNCSEHGVCLGSADLQLNPDCLNVSHPPRTFPDLPTFPAEFLSSPATREQQAAMPPTSIPQFATKVCSLRPVLGSPP
eukprot:281886-Hanusia_phi.AAC.1